MARAKEKLDYTALRQALRTQGPERLYLLWGVEDYLIRDFTHQVREVCLGGRPGDFDCRRLDGPAPDPEEVEQALAAMPFLCPRTFVELRDMEPAKLRGERLMAALRDIPEWCTVVITLPAGVELPGGEWTDELRKLACVVEFTPQKQALLYKWIARRFSAGGKTIGREATDRLVFLSGDLMNRLIPEIEKISAYARGPEVTVEDVEAVAHHIPEADVFRMTEYIAQGDVDSAAGILGELLAGDQEPIKILGTLGWQIRRLYAARLGRDTGRGEEYVRQVLGIRNDYILRRLASAAGGFTLDGLAAGVRLCAEADWRLKTSAGDGGALLREFLVRFAMDNCHA